MSITPAQLLVAYAPLLVGKGALGPVLDLACGECHNGLYLAGLGLSVTCCDRSPEALAAARRLARAHNLRIRTWRKDLEAEDAELLPADNFAAIVVFRYLHRPLIPSLQAAVVRGGVIIYETFTVAQKRYGRPRNPDYLLKPGELRNWFKHWIIHHWFEGPRENPRRAVAQLVAEKPQLS